MFEGIADNPPHRTAEKDQAMAYWTDQNRFPPHRSRVDKLIDPQTPKERRRAKRFRGLVGAMAVMAMMPKHEITMYNGE